MLRRFSNSRTFQDNLRLGVFTALIAGMVNVASLVLFYSFTSNLTGHFAILAQEIADGKWFQMLVVLFWIVLFFSGSFLSNNLIINSTRKNAFVSHSIPMVLEIGCFIFVGIYGQFFYAETLTQTEILVAVLLFSMGLQNGLTASISNFQVKTTHLTGLTTDLAIHLSLLTKKKYRMNAQVVEKTKLMAAIMSAYLAGGVFSGLIIQSVHFQVFYFISAAMLGVLTYDFVKTYVPFYVNKKKHDMILKTRLEKIQSTLKNTAKKNGVLESK
ncbi:YoaK family protein [Fluviicola chungangensis]|uniref:DUF1275 domain-containing protein n=1 Tax=Fluviicola chungangensis TaxID=2597671 RepID=A0A556N780_9FLAO|nr:YoaK family protein [Fluviicola chungangensis]TSJ48036.1 DUF1275 domain-containing protein [Fluviicola chungangensis]